MKKHSLSQKLFRTYASLFILGLLVILCICVWYTAAVISKGNRDMQNQLMRSLDENVENYFEEMNAFSMELMNSVDFKDTALQKLPEAEQMGENTSQLFSVLYRVAYKMIQKDYKVGIIVDGKYYIWMGNGYYINEIGDGNISTYDTLIRNEKPVVKYLEKNEYLVQTSGDYYQDEKEREYITLSRSMDRSRKYMNGRAILEIHVDAQEFYAAMMKISGKQEEGGIRMNLYSEDGKALYCESQIDLAGYADVPEGEISYKDGNMVIRHKIFDDRINIIYTIDRREYYNGLISFLGLAFLSATVIFAAVTWFAYHISRQISSPIRSMCESVKAINLEKGVFYQKVETNIYELEFLSDSLSHMSEELRESLNNIISLKEYELHARMLALQAQMQPHFLVNTLATIGTMAEEAGNRKIFSMCINLTQMFRYIAADADNGVKIFEEMRQIERYVDIMKERFPDSNVYMDMPLELMDCTIPKLTIQPLVENAFKYCNRRQAVIKVSGVAVGEEKWKVIVEDNGNGFSQGKVDEIMRKCREEGSAGKVFSGKIDGMGLVNVFERLKLFYGEDMIYQIEAGHGRVTIGGRRYAGK